MISKHKYLLITNNRKSIIQSNEESIEFDFENSEEHPVLIFEAQISNFFDYEHQVRQQLEKLNYKVKPWRKNIFYFSIPNNLSEVQMRCYFDSADHLDAIESYLLKENIAILLTPEFHSAKKETVLLISHFKTKIEFSVIENLEFKYLKTLYADEEIMNSHLDLSRTIEKYVTKIERTYRINHSYVISNNDVFTIEAYKKFKKINNADKLILEGLRIASEKEVSQLYNRLKL